MPSVLCFTPHDVLVADAFAVACHRRIPHEVQCPRTVRSRALPRHSSRGTPCCVADCVAVRSSRLSTSRSFTTSSCRTSSTRMPMRRGLLRESTTRRRSLDSRQTQSTAQPANHHRAFGSASEFGFSGAECRARAALPEKEGEESFSGGGHLSPSGTTIRSTTGKMSPKSCSITRSVASRRRTR